ncbi:MAG: hypothetical protein WEC79_07495, partial [Thermomicrobiales bacterium]
PRKGGAIRSSAAKAPPFLGEGLGRGLPASDSALLVPPDDPAALAGAIERLCSGELRERIASAGREVYAQHADAAARARVMGEVIERVMGSRWQRQPVRG